MAQINWTLESERWLRDIYDYIASDNPHAAIRLVEGIHQRVQIMHQFPLLGIYTKAIRASTFAFCTTVITEFLIS